MVRSNLSHIVPAVLERCITTTPPESDETQSKTQSARLVLNGLLEARDMMTSGLAPLSACASANVQANLRIVLLIFYYTTLLDLLIYLSGWLKTHL